MRAGGLSLNKWFAQAGAQIPARDAASMIGGARDGGLTNWAWLLVGALFTWALIVGRARFAWFPFHPMGYAMALTGPAHQMWFLDVFWAGAPKRSSRALAEPNRRGAPRRFSWVWRWATFL